MGRQQETEHMAYWVAINRIAAGCPPESILAQTFPSLALCGLAQIMASESEAVG